MKKILLLGASGQLGSAIYQKLASQNMYDLRLLVREDSNYIHLKPSNPEIIYGDLTDKQSLANAVDGCKVVICTANAAAPRKKTDKFYSVDVQGYRDLIDTCRSQGVEQFIYTSIVSFGDKLDSWVPLSKAKTATEAYLKVSGLNYTIFKPCAFMDVYFTFMGTDMLVKNEPTALVNRPWSFMQKFYSSVKDDIHNGRIGINGRGNVRHSFITIDNVADFIVRSIGHADFINGTFPIGGPEALTTYDVKGIFESVLNKPLTVKKTPAFMLRTLGNLMSPFNSHASNIFKLNYVNATKEAVVDCTNIAGKLNIRLISAEEYIKSKANG
jgi:uncharacterized protein YbjT (DUF2867 family)